MGSNDTVLLISCILLLVIFNFVGNNIKAEFSDHVDGTNYELFTDENILSRDQGFILNSLSMVWDGVKFIFAIMVWNVNIPVYFQIFPIMFVRLMTYYILLRLIRGTG
jgi:hypothetical protein